MQCTGMFFLVIAILGTWERKIQFFTFNFTLTLPNEMNNFYINL